jgi:hypothetical protein
MMRPNFVYVLSDAYRESWAHWRSHEQAEKTLPATRRADDETEREQFWWAANEEAHAYLAKTDFTLQKPCIN